MGTHKLFGQVPETDVTSLVTDLGNKQPLDSDLTAIAAISPSNDDVVQRKSGAWTNRTPAQLKTDLAVTASDVGLGSVNNTSDAGKPVSTATQTALDLKQNLDSDLTTIAGLTATTDNVIQSVASAWASRTPAQLKATLGLVKGDVGLGSVDNTADASKPISTLQQAGLDAKQNLDSDLTTIAGLTATTDSILQSKSSAWTTRTPAQFKTDLVLVKGDVGLGSVDNVQQQPLDADLTTIAGLTATTDSFIQSKASAWSSRTLAQVRADIVLLKPFPPVTLTPGTTPALDASLGTHFRLAMAQNATIAIPTNPTEGQVITIEATSDATPRTLALNTGTGGFRFGSDITALTAHAASKTDYVQAVYRTSTNKWDVIGYVKGF